jgi:hypothetical protein
MSMVSEDLAMYTSVRLSTLASAQSCATTSFDNEAPARENPRRKGRWAEIHNNAKYQSALLYNITIIGNNNGDFDLWYKLISNLKRK